MSDARPIEIEINGCHSRLMVSGWYLRRDFLPEKWSIRLWGPDVPGGFTLQRDTHAEAVAVLDEVKRQFEAQGEIEPPIHWMPGRVPEWTPARTPEELRAEAPRVAELGEVATVTGVFVARDFVVGEGFRTTVQEWASPRAEEKGRRWPGPWFQDDPDGPWGRNWSDGDEAIFTHFDGSVYLPDGDSGERVGPTLASIHTAADMRAANAILATICDGKDPHPIPAEVLGEGEG